MSKTYLNGKAIDGFHEVHEHVSPISLYNKIIAVLFVLTGLTYAVSFADLGAASLTVAMFVATIKAALVIGYFMHLKYDDRYHLFVFAGTIIFVSIFFGFTMFDIQARTALNDEQETFMRIRELENSGAGPKLGVDNTPERAEAIKKEIEAHGGGHGGGHDAKGHDAGHDAKAPAAGAAPAKAAEHAPAH
jgi:caa(3)-type oxidase subunit IV